LRYEEPVLLLDSQQLPLQHQFEQQEQPAGVGLGIIPPRRGSPKQQHQKQQWQQPQQPDFYQEQHQAQRRLEAEEEEDWEEVLRRYRQPGSTAAME
jgi:hypothetical protein